MDFAYSEKVNELRARMNDFMERHVYPNERTYHEQIAASGNPFHHAEIVDELKAQARAEGQWNLFLPDNEYGAGLTNQEYAPLAEITGRVHWAPEVFNCSAPDTGNMEILAQFGTPDQKRDWLQPLLDGEIRSAFAMTEPEVASSDATNIQLTIRREGDEYVLDGHKWWISGAMRPRCKILIVMGKTAPDSSDRHRQQSMILVPVETPGVTVVRNLPVFGYIENESHCEVTFEGVRVPASNILAARATASRLREARLGPGRIHHCMRCIGAAQRALELMCRARLRACRLWQATRPAGRHPGVDRRVGIEIEQARLLTLKAAWMIDTVGKKAAQNEIAMIKVVAPN